MNNKKLYSSLGIQGKDDPLYSTSMHETTVQFINQYNRVHFETTKSMEKIFNKTLFPSVNCCSIYRGGTGLDWSVEPEWCEYSMIICLKNEPKDRAWITKFKQSDVVDPSGFDSERGKLEFTLHPGDAIVYRGSRDFKRRRALPDNNMFYELALHYVNAHGEQASYTNSGYKDYLSYLLNEDSA